MMCEGGKENKEVDDDAVVVVGVGIKKCSSPPMTCSGWSVTRIILEGDGNEKVKESLLPINSGMKSKIEFVSSSRSLNDVGCSNSKVNKTGSTAAAAISVAPFSCCCCCCCCCSGCGGGGGGARGGNVAVVVAGL